MEKWRNIKIYFLINIVINVYLFYHDDDCTVLLILLFTLASNVHWDGSFIAYIFVFGSFIAYILVFGSCITYIFVFGSYSRYFRFWIVYSLYISFWFVYSLYISFWFVYSPYFRFWFIYSLYFRFWFVYSCGETIQGYQQRWEGRNYWTYFIHKILFHAYRLIQLYSVHNISLKNFI